MSLKEEYLLLIHRAILSSINRNFYSKVTKFIRFAVFILYVNLSRHSPQTKPQTMIYYPGPHQKIFSVKVSFYFIFEMISAKTCSADF